MMINSKGNKAPALAGQLVKAAVDRGLRLSTAESCTGGLISAYITSVPGASAALDGALVSYAEGIKERLLGVPEGLIKRHGVVSVPVVRSMARGAAELFGADIAVAVSGIAGPSGALPGKPVGTVCICVYRRFSDGRGVSRAVTRHFKGDRNGIREQTALAALGYMKDAVNNQHGFAAGNRSDSKNKATNILTASGGMDMEK